MRVDWDETGGGSGAFSRFGRLTADSDVGDSREAKQPVLGEAVSAVFSKRQSAVTFTGLQVIGVPDACLELGSFGARRAFEAPKPAFAAGMWKRRHEYVGRVDLNSRDQL